MEEVMSQSGDALVMYRPGATVTAFEEYPDLPRVFACVVARYKGEILFVFNNYRELWELPAGRIEAGESALSAGHRELMEESGQGGAVLKQAGLALMRLKNGCLEPGVMFTCELTTKQPFTPNEEISALMFWDMEQPVSGEVDHVSRKLVELVNL